VHLDATARDALVAAAYAEVDPRSFKHEGWRVLIASSCGGQSLRLRGGRRRA
jgi:hypothetical protein